MPALAAKLAWRDASWTHRRTGIYGTMFIAAAIAMAQVMPDRLGIFETALQFVPRRSRFYEITADCLQEVRQASDWLEPLHDDIHTALARFYERSLTMLAHRMGELPRRVADALAQTPPAP